MVSIVKSTCGICLESCGILVHLEDGKPFRIEGDPDSPMSRGALCAKGRASLEYLCNPQRLRHPLKRVGDRGEGKWQQISWEEALDIVAKELCTLKDTHGANSLNIIRGAHKGLQVDYMTRFANAFGTPNISSMASVCWNPQDYAARITHGFYPVPDYEFPPAGILVWAANLSETAVGRYSKTLDAINQGSALAVVDPVNIELTQKADIWVKPRPGSDLALCLALINVIIQERLYDEDFVDKWSEGFDDLRSHVEQYSPASVSEITWVSEASIRKLARWYATKKPACILWGNGIEHNLNGFQTGRAISILRAITGNLCVPGGELECQSLPLLEPSSREFSLRDLIPSDVRSKRISANDGMLPITFYALPQRVVESILEGVPYPIRGVFIMGANPLLSYSNTRDTYAALKKLDFIAISELFMTPTASLADIVLPVRTYLEYDSIRILAKSLGYPTALVQQKVADVEECRSDYEIFRDLAKRLGFGKYFWDTEEECLDFILKPSGLSFSEFRRVGAIQSTKLYRSYRDKGFQTPSGKVELYSSQLSKWGFDPIPSYVEPPETPCSDPELARDFPLIMTSIKPEPFRHSEGRQIPALRQTRPHPVTLIHPDTAQERGIADGDWIYIETKRGRIVQKAALSSSIDPRVVVVDYGWWFPEKSAVDLYGYRESNINVLTDNKPPHGREVGAANLRGLLCRVYRAAG